MGEGVERCMTWGLTLTPLSSTGQSLALSHDEGIC